MAGRIAIWDSFPNFFWRIASIKNNSFSVVPTLIPGRARPPLEQFRTSTTWERGTGEFNFGQTRFQFHLNELISPSTWTCDLKNKLRFAEVKLIWIREVQSKSNKKGMKPWYGYCDTTVDYRRVIARIIRRVGQKLHKDPLRCDQGKISHDENSLLTLM